MRLLLSAIVGVSLLPSCNNLGKEVDIDLPKFEAQLVVEAYLERNEPLRVSVTRTSDYFGTFQLPFIQNAKVVLSYGGTVDTLSFNPIPDFENLKWYNYQTLDSIPIREGLVYNLTVIDSAGRIATASTSWLREIQVDSIELSNIRTSDTTLFLITHFFDPPGPNFYRFRAAREGDTIPDVQDFILNDIGFDGQKITLGTGYDFHPGDTAVVTLYNIRKEYYEYLSSIIAANDANGNPFGTPATIKGNVKGGLGIFTVLPQSRKYRIIPE